MTTHNDVIHKFATREKPLRGRNIFTLDNTIYSYGMHFPMAIAFDDAKMFLINGDRYSITTTGHQNHLRGSLSNTDYTCLTIPFSALHQARIAKGTIKLLEMGKEVNEYRCDICGVIDYQTWRDTIHTMGENGHNRRYRHLLAPSLITAKRDSSLVYFLSGFDETSKDFGGGYFLSELPHSVKTIEEAFISLQPNPVREAIENGLDVKRQGDIFGIPTDVSLRKLKKIGRVMPLRYLKPLLDWDNKVLAYEETSTIEGPSSFIRGHFRPQLLGTNHYATEAYQVGDDVYARGMLYHKPAFRDADHKNIKLGKVWHRIYRNTAVNSWSSNGKVD